MPYLGASPDKGNFADLNGGKLIIDADADTSITADTDDQIDIEIAGADDFKFTANTFTVLSGSTLTVASGATIANSGTATGFGGADPSSADGDTLGTASAEWSDLYLADGGVIYFGNDQDVTVTHDPDDGLIVKSIATADNNPLVLTLQTGETTMVADEPIAQIHFQAPDESSGTDSILIAATIQATAETDFSASVNATSLDFLTGNSAAAGSDGGSLILSSTGNLTLKDLRTADGSSPTLTLQSGDTDMAASDVLGKIAFQAPDEGAGTDAIEVAAAIQARSEGDFSSTANATSLDFLTGLSAVAAKRWSITSAGSFLNAGTNTIDMNGGEIILAPNGNASITASTNDQIDIRIASADDFTFTPNTFTAESGSEIVQTDGTLYMNETANGQQTLGITINCGAADNEVMTFKSSDVAHDGTAFSNESDTFGMFKKFSAAEGGLYMQGFSEGTTGIGGVAMHETQPGTSPATGTATSAYIYYAACYDTDYGYDANSLIWGLRRITDGGSWRSIMFIDEDGDIHLDGTSNDTVFDEEDDAMLCRSLDLMRSPNKTIRTTFDQWTQNHKTTLEDAGIISKIDPADQWDEDGNRSDPMVNITQLQRLHNGAIWQQRAMFETMKQVAEEMLPGFGAKLNERLVEQKLPALPVPA